MNNPNVVKSQSPKKGDIKALEKRWGTRVWAIGFTGVPSLLIRGQRRLGLSPVQLNVLLQLLDHWQKRGNMPLPSKKTIAERMGMTPRYIQQIIKELEGAGFVARKFRKTSVGDWNTNVYDLGGLVRKLQELEPEFTKELKGPGRGEASRIGE